ncbi:MAG: FxsA family protein [Acidimicrobiales bacterium]
MVGLLFLLFLVLPFVELYVILQVGQAIGVLNTIGLLLVVSAVGAWLVKREGIGVVRRAQQRMAEGVLPGRELVDGVLIVFAGALLITPGFVTDVVGVALLLPPVRAVLRGGVIRALGRRGGLEPYRRR